MDLDTNASYAPQSTNGNYIIKKLKNERKPDYDRKAHDVDCDFLERTKQYIANNTTPTHTIHIRNGYVVTTNPQKYENIL